MYSSVSFRKFIWIGFHMVSLGSWCASSVACVW